jgi:uncharacterized membrane protein
MTARARLLLGGALLAVGIACWWILILAPALPSNQRGRFELLAALLLGRVCHRLPERSLWLCGAPLGVCARCSAIYVGFGIGLLSAWGSDRERDVRRWLLGVAPMGIDGLLSLLQIWDSPLWLRLATGLLAGASLARLLWPAYAQLWAGRPRGAELIRGGGSQ